MYMEIIQVYKKYGVAEKFHLSLWLKPMNISILDPFLIVQRLVALSLFELQVNFVVVLLSPMTEFHSLG